MYYHTLLITYVRPCTDSDPKGVRIRQQEYYCKMKIEKLCGLCARLSVAFDTSNHNLILLSLKQVGTSGKIQMLTSNLRLKLKFTCLPIGVLKYGPEKLEGRVKYYTISAILSCLYRRKLVCQ